MASIEVDGRELRFRCTARTVTIYEQEFHNDPYKRVTGDIIADCFGRQRVDESSIWEVNDKGEIVAVTIDFVRDNWLAEWRALWAMVKTQAEIDAKHGEKVEPVPSYLSWCDEFAESELHMREIGKAVLHELARGLF